MASMARYSRPRMRNELWGTVTSWSIGYPSEDRGGMTMGQPIDQIRSDTCLFCKRQDTPHTDHGMITVSVLYHCSKEPHAKGTEPCAEMHWNQCPHNKTIVHRKREAHPGDA